MVRTLLCVAMVACAQVAVGRPPDAIARSPIPPLHESARQRVPRGTQRAAVRTQPAEPPSLLPISPTAPRATLGIIVPPKSRPSAPQERADANVDNEERNPIDYATDPKVIWNSPEMREARYYVMEFSRRAVGTSPAEGEQFLERLSQLSADKMRDWFKRYETRRMNIMVERSLEQMARRLILEQAISRQEAVRQAYANVSQLKEQAAEAMRLRAELLAIAQEMQREDALTLDLRSGYDPMYPSFDPARRLAEDLLLGVPIEQAAAAASLPGDLPRDDPRNFERGDEDDDFVELGEEE